MATKLWTGGYDCMQHHFLSRSSLQDSTFPLYGGNFIFLSNYHWYPACLFSQKILWTTQMLNSTSKAFSSTPTISGMTHTITLIQARNACLCTEVRREVWSSRFYPALSVASMSKKEALPQLHWIFSVKGHSLAWKVAYSKCLPFM